jgi:pimeloyl-ACP methyl ester carboxylesterase
LPYVPLPHAGRIHYSERGERREGQSSALLIHGAGASSAIWMMVLARVARVGHAVAIDLPAHGASAREGTALDGTPGLSMARYRDAVGELAGALCLGPSVLVGHSLGALVAMEAALAWPDKVRGLVLVGAAPRLSVHEELGRLLRDDAARVPAWLAEHALSPRAKPAVRRGFLAAGAAADADITRADYEIVRTTDLSGRMASIRCPITWVDGADDKVVPSTDSRRGELVGVADAGHLLPIEAPGPVAEAVMGRLGRVQPERASG